MPNRMLKALPQGGFVDRGQIAMQAAIDHLDVTRHCTNADITLVAEAVGVSTSFLRRAMAIRRAAPDLVSPVLAGRRSLNSAYESTRGRKPDKHLDRTPSAREKRDAKIREMADEGYDEDAIAAAVGLTRERVLHAMHHRLGIPNLRSRLGLSRTKLDANRVMESLVTAAQPSPEAIAAVDLASLDLRQIPAWVDRLTAAIHEWTALRNTLRRAYGNHERSAS